jgi:hypothetical protein
MFSFIATITLACTEKRTNETQIKITRDKNGKTTTTTTVTSHGESVEKPIIKTEQVNLEIKRKHLFSDPAKPDNFELKLDGTSVLNSKVSFTISDPAGKIIYHDSLTAADLEASMVYEMKTSKPTEKQREDFIKKRLNEFFDEKNFTFPAIAPNDIYDPTYGEEASWNAIKKEPKSISFNYLIGKENGRRVAYSKLRKKVMLVGNFGG